jgi:hypothetical protein
LFLRYIDDIFGTADCGEANLLSFMEFVDQFHPALRFTWEISTNSVNFLDMSISFNGDQLATSVHYKETDSHSYLTYTSSHPTSCKDSIPYSQLLRLRRLCSDDADFDIQADKMVNFFHERGYPSNITNTALHRCQAITREESLRNKDTSNNCQRTPLVLTYHPSIAPVSDIIKRNWKIISEHPSTKDIFTDPPLLSLRRDKNTKDLLVRASLPADDQQENSSGTTPCRRRRCNTCRHVLSTGTVAGPDGTYHIKKSFTCVSTHVIYAIGCKRHPNVLYIGETERRLADRFTEHRRDIYLRDVSKPVPQHFTTDDHTLDDVTVTALTQVHNKRDRRTTEQRIIFQLGTLKPNGMNVQFHVFNARK